MNWDKGLLKNGLTIRRCLSQFEEAVRSDDRLGVYRAVEGMQKAIASINAMMLSPGGGHEAATPSAQSAEEVQAAEGQPGTAGRESVRPVRYGWFTGQSPDHPSS